MFRKKLFFITLIAIFFSATGALAQNDKTDSAILQIMNSRPVAGLSVVVVKDNRPVYTKSFGYKNIESKEPLTNESIFRIASISKSFTSTSLMQLVEKNKIGLDNDISKLIGFTVRNPKFPGKVITLRMILSHTSSINDSQGYFTLDVMNPDKNPDWQKCFSDYAPGDGYKYCNLNFNMAGTVLEKISGERFDHYVLNHILKPLKIYGGYNVNELDSNLFATLYDYNADSGRLLPQPAAYAPRKTEIENYVSGYSTPLFSPTGGMKVSATGLARYMLMHMNNGKLGRVRIISSKSEQEMRKPVSSDENYGLALLTTDKLIPGETLIGHTGSAYGLSSAMFFEPHKKFGIVIICNGSDQQYTDGYNAIIKEVMQVLYDRIVR